MSAGERSYRLGAGARRSADGRLLVGGWPPRCVRLSAAGARALDAALAARPAAAAGAGALVRRLVAYGMLDPVAGPGEARLTFVVPMRDGGAAIVPLVAALLAQGPVIVVDDGSSDGSPDLARRAGAAVVANASGAGPAGARNTGWRLAESDFVAFVDADCRVDGNWALPLAGLLASEPSLALAAPRVRGTEERGRLARWERTRSPLDMGAAGGLVGPGRRVPFLPSAALVARRSALLELGGFDEAMRFGEDVELVWRAVAAGWEVRYAPELEVRHPARPTLRARARQHFEYGTSAAALEVRHPGAAAPLRAGRSIVPAALLGAGSAPAAVLAAAALTLAAAARGSDAPVRRAVARLVLDAQLSAGRELARAACRDWLPLTILAASLGGRARRGALLALALDAAAATAPDPPAAAVNAPLRLADNAAYCAGLWRGALARRSPRALLPRRGRPAAPGLTGEAPDGYRSPPPPA